MLRRNQPAQTDRKKKISLPAALFNRSPLKNAQNSSMISNTSFNNEPSCQNHPNKKGKYAVITEEIQEEEETFYCEKCAILLASKGFEVKKLDYEVKTVEKRKLNPREQELANFMADVDTKIKQLRENKKQSAQQLSQIEQAHEEKIQKIEQFFEDLYTLLEKHKNRQIHETSLKKKEAEEELATYLGYATEKIQLLETMKEDVESSHDSIVRDTPEEDYQLVMSHYQGNLGEIKVEALGIAFPDPVLPSAQSIESVLAQLFEGGRSGTCFSFDSTKKPYE